MKLKFFAVFFIFFQFSLNAAGIGAGGLFTLKNGAAGGVRMDFQSGSIPFVFETETLFCKDGVDLVLGGVEFLAGNIHLAKALNFYYAPKLSLGWNFCGQEFIVANGFFTGLYAFAIPRTQFFLEAGWNPEILFSADDLDFNLVNFPFLIGVRFWSD